MDSATLRGGLWSAAEYLFRFGVQFGLSVVLARLLSPTDFGVYALTYLFSSLSWLLVDGGFSNALIQKQDADQRTETAIFHYNLIAAAVLALAIAAIAPMIARAYGHPVLRDLLYANAGVLFVTSFLSVPAALLHKRREFASIARLSMISSTLGAVVGAAAAFMGAGIWTFVIQGATTQVYSAVAVWRLSNWRPRGGFDLRPARSLLGFGSLLTLSGLLEVGYSNGYPLVLGRLYGATDVGYFNRGQNIQANPTGVVTGVIQRMLFPILASKLQDRASLRDTTKRAVITAMAINAPIMVFLAFFSDLVIRVVYGAKWLPSAPVLTILATGGVLFPLHVINLQVILAYAESRLYLKLEVWKKLLGIGLVVIGCFYGVIGLALSQLAFVFFAFFLNASPARRLVDYAAVEQLRDLAGPLFLSLAVMGPLWIVQPYIGSTNFIRLAILLAASGSLYAAVAVLLRIGPFHELLHMVRSRPALGT